jgi:uncharacterized protein (DUF1015 family)
MQIKPFKAFRFNPAVVGDVGSCIAPPYDVISEDARYQLLEKSRYNIVRVTKPTPGLLPVAQMQTVENNSVSGDEEYIEQPKPKEAKEGNQYARTGSIAAG